MKSAPKFSLYEFSPIPTSKKLKNCKNLEQILTRKMKDKADKKRAEK